MKHSKKNTKHQKGRGLFSFLMGDIQEPNFNFLPVPYVLSYEEEKEIENKNSYYISGIHQESIEKIKVKKSSDIH